MISRCIKKTKPGCSVTKAASKLMQLFFYFSGLLLNRLMINSKPVVLENPENLIQLYYAYENI
jgi:hypothetical protein